MKHIKQFEELNIDTYLSASDKLKHKGFHTRSRNLSDYALQLENPDFYNHKGKDSRMYPYEFYINSALNYISNIEELEKTFVIEFIAEDENKFIFYILKENFNILPRPTIDDYYGFFDPDEETDYDFLKNGEPYKYDLKLEKGVMYSNRFDYYNINIDRNIDPIIWIEKNLKLVKQMFEDYDATDCFLNVFFDDRKSANNLRKILKNEFNFDINPNDIYTEIN